MVWTQGNQVTWFKLGPTYSVHSVCSGSVTSQSRWQKPREVKVMRVQEQLLQNKNKQQIKKVMWSPLGVIFFKKRMILLLKMGWFMKSSPHTPSPTKTALAAVISGCRGGLL